MAAATQMRTQTRADGASKTTTKTTTTTTTAASRLAAGMLTHAHAPYAFAFTPFLQATYHHGLPADRAICKAYSAGHCPLGTRCPDRHISSSASGTGRDHGGFNSLVCKHWLRGLCKKGEGCEFLHEYNLRKMPECNFFLRNGYCSNGDECLYLHIDPRSKLPPCPDYDDRGFCALGPACPKKHVRRALCPCYLAGFCPDGRTCRAGAHPHWSAVAAVPPGPAAIAAIAAAAEEAAAAATAAAEAAAAAEHDHNDYGGGGGDDDSGADDGSHWDHRGNGYRDKYGGGGRGGGGGGRWRGRGGGGGGGHKFRGRGH